MDRKPSKAVCETENRLVTDFYQLYDNLSQDDKRTLLKVRTFMENDVAPVINDYWIEDEFPFGLLRYFKELDITGKDNLLTGFITMELARVDPSIATFYGCHSSLAMRSISELGTAEQKKKWLPAMKRFKKIGCFALTEPDIGSGIRDMKTTAVYEPQWNSYVLNGQKKWIGNSTWCDISIIWAKEDDKIKGFIVENKTKGFTVEKIKDKFGLKVVQNGTITLNSVAVPAENCLGEGFKEILKTMRYLAACEATGLQVGAYEHSLKYAKERYQFGKPIASFQLIQDMLAKMLANVTACQCLVFQLGQTDFNDSQAALAKAFCTSKARETVSMAREIFGANGLSIEYNIGRYFTDIEAIYTYEGSYQMQNLIVGKQITGLSAFV